MPRSGATLVNSGTGGIGDVKKSMLSEALFQAQNGTGWVLMDGRNVSGSRYHTLTGSVTIPDHRGVSSRGKNNGRADGNQNPDGEVALGTFQSHQHSSHSHTIQAGNANVGGAVANQIEAGQTLSNNVPRPTLGDGGNETRMKNISVNYFIKIN